ncbi:MAG TPA: hypothetical protein VGS08_00810 [Candidatus Saccharimonadales bacterium]|nr:hypothetical protein [Candidatus Saccharimonadales bacterium]
MAVPKQYLHDRLVLLLISTNAFLAFLCVVSALLHLASGQGTSGPYIVQYRSNLGISAFKTGSVTVLLSFIVYAIVVCIMNIFLSIKTYHLRRQLAVAILSLGMLLLLLDVIVSNALLVLR